MAAATSLIQLILKKWGDDAAGAAKELEEKVGFPESVANRIASGELPMDAESVAKRAQDQGYGDAVYHGSTNPMLTDAAPMEVGKRNATGGNGLFVTDNPRVASTYAYDSRVSGGKGPDGGTVYPLRVKGVQPNEKVTVKDRGFNGDQYTTYWDEIPAENIRGMDTYLDSDPGHYLETDQINRSANREGKKTVEYTRLMDSAEDVYGIGGTDVPSNVTAVLDNTLLRSPNAAFDPEYTGPNIMGGLLAGGVGLGALGQSEDADAGFITKGGKTLLEAWHGSPHKFDKFSMDQIGTGEGVQQYGHGLYFADDIDTAKGFQPRDPDREEWMYEQYKAAEEAGDQYMMDAWERAMMHDSPIELRASAADPDYGEHSQAAFAEVADALSANPGTGSLSRVEIDVAPDSLLDYDKPLKEQSELVQNFFAGREGITPDTNGRALSESLLKGREPGLSLKELSAIASREMNEAGIRGLQYQDWVNQAEGSNLRNYVIFDDSLINIAERGNATVPMLGATALGTAGLLATPALMKDGVFQHGATSEPVVERREPVRNQSGLLESVTDFGDEVFKSVRHAAGPLADVLMPYEGVNNYLKTVNDYDKQPTWWDRLGLLDW